MANYIVGDIQGCLEELKKLLEHVNFDPKVDYLWLVGDLVARGPHSLETLRYISQMGSAALPVLGNHDLHLLAVSLGIFPAKPQDRTAPILEAPDREALLYWLRHQPLLREHDDFVVCHAGIYPNWTLSEARHYANQVEDVLQSDNWPWLIKHMYGDQPDHWHPQLSELAQYRFTIHAFTRMRFCNDLGYLDFHCKLPPDEVDPTRLLPWFQVKHRQQSEKTIIFGHWAALGHYQDQHVIGLDTGCVWGNCLTMLRWEDQQYFSQPALSAAK